MPCMKNRYNHLVSERGAARPRNKGRPSFSVHKSSLYNAVLLRLRTPQMRGQGPLKHSASLIPLKGSVNLSPIAAASLSWVSLMPSFRKSMHAAYKLLGDHENI